MFDLKTKAVLLMTLFAVNLVSFLFGGWLGVVVLLPSIGFVLHLLRR